MKPQQKHQSLFFTPRTPWGTRLTGRTFYDHMRASEDSRELPEEDKDGRWQGKIEISGGNQGKPESSFGVQLNSNPQFRDTHQDPLAGARKEHDPHMAELDKQRAREHAQKAAQDAQAKKAAQAAQKPKQPSRWKFTAPSASAQRVPGL